MPSATPPAERRAGLTFNGKFLTAKPTGVHRVAYELLKAIGQQAPPSAAGGPVMRILTPPAGAARPAAAIPVVPAGRIGGQIWEQVELPRLAGQDLIVSLCNIGPVVSRRAVTLIHDAQVFLTPDSYSAAFKLKYRVMLPLIGRRHRRIITVSDYSRQQLAGHGVAPLDRIAVVHNGVDHILSANADTTILATLGLAPGQFVVALANTQKHKNIRVLFDAFALPELQAVTLLLVGSADRAAFAAFGHHAPPNVHFASGVSDAALRALMEAALCLAFPSTTEGFGLPPLEAMLVGCPAVVAPCGALPEVCGDAVLYCAPDDPQAWSAGISRLYHNPEERAALAARGVSHAARFTWENAGRQLLAILHQELDHLE